VRIAAIRKNDRAVRPGCDSLFYAREDRFAVEYFRDGALTSRCRRHFLLLPGRTHTVRLINLLTES